MEKKEKTFKRKSVEIRPTGPCKLPVRFSKAGTSYVLALPEDVRVPARSRISIPLNFTMKMPVGLEARIDPMRDSVCIGLHGYGQKTVKKRYGFITLKKKESGHRAFDADVQTSKIDATYEKGIEVIIVNRDESFLIRKWTKIAQMTFYSTTIPFIVNAVDLLNREEGQDEQKCTQV